MAAIWRPPKGLVLDGREHGGNVNGGGRKIASTAEVAPDFKLPVPGIPTDGGKRKWEPPSESVKTATSISSITLTVAAREFDKRGTLRPALAGLGLLFLGQFRFPAHALPALLRPAAALGGAGADKVALHVGQAAENGNHQAPGAGAGVGPRLMYPATFRFPYRMVCNRVTLPL